MPQQQTSGSFDSKSYDSHSPSDLTGDEKILWEARERFRICCDYNSTIRAEALEDLNFFHGDQWNSLILRERTEDRRPALTINKLPTYVMQVSNDMRQNRPAIKVRPIDSVTDPGTAEVIDGMIRYIMSNNDVKAALDTALEYAVICGQGYLRIYCDYKDSNTFEQDIIVERIDNPLSVYFPIALCKQVDFSDAPYCFIRTSMSKDEFKRQYGEKAANEIMNWQGNGIGDSNWTEENLVWLAEYFSVEETPATLYQLSDGTTTFDKPKDESTIINSRDSSKRKVMWRLMSEMTILEEEEFPSPYIPVIPINGWELNVDGRKSFLSLLRFAKDPQRLYNYYKSMEAEIVSLAPKAPWLVAAGQIENFENDWKVANTKNLAYLEYNPTASSGQPVPPPQRIDPPQIPAAAVNGMREASDDIKSVTGLFDASLGARGNETSGKAIIARQRQGDTATYHFTDNVIRAVRQMGRIIVGLIPIIYDVPRAVRILGEDMTQKVILVNQIHQDNITGESRLYDITVGKYDVTVDVGPSYESKRVEAADNLTRIIQAVPTIGQVCSDILVRNLDFPGAQELAERLKRTIPPQLLQDPNGDPNHINPADIQAIVQDMQALQNQLQMSESQKAQMAQIIQAYDRALKDKTVEHQLKLQQTAIKADAELKKAEMGMAQSAMEHEHNATYHAVDKAIDLSGKYQSQPDGQSMQYQPIQQG